MPCPWFPEVARWAKDHPTTDLGIHQALNSEWTTLRWGPISSTDKVSSLLAADGYLPLDTDAISPGIEAKDWTAWYEKELATLGPGVYEVIVHLAYDDDEMRGATADHPDWGAAWRQHDLDMVKNAGFQKFLKEQGFVLVGWKDLARALPSNYGK